MIFKTIHNSLEKVAKNPNHLQLLLQEKTIFNWYKNQLKKLNEEFLEDMIPYKGKINKKDILKNYLLVIDKLKDNYPSALINKVKINKIDFNELLKCN